MVQQFVSISTILRYIFVRFRYEISHIEGDWLLTLHLIFLSEISAKFPTNLLQLSVENSSPGVFRNNERRLGMKVPKGSPPNQRAVLPSRTLFYLFISCIFLYFLFFQCDHEHCNKFFKEIVFFSILLCEPLIMITSLSLEEFELSYTPGRKCEKLLLFFFQIFPPDKHVLTSF